MAELLFWPAFLAYGEAAFAYVVDARLPGSQGRLATWGVRIGWLVQTALLISQAAWNRISAEDRAKLTADAQALETRVRTEAPAQDAESVKVMSSRGLQVTTLDPKALAEFRGAADQLVKTMRGSMVPPDIYDTAVQERDAFRKSKGK